MMDDTRQVSRLALRCPRCGNLRDGFDDCYTQEEIREAIEILQRRAREYFGWREPDQPNPEKRAGDTESKK